MRPKIEFLLNETNEAMCAYSALYMFRLSNISIEAKAIALISTSVTIGGNSCGLEVVSTINIPNKNQYAIYPKNEEYIMPIINGVRDEHPEYSVSLENLEQEESLTQEELDELGIKREDIQEPVDHYLLFTIPDVDEARRDSYVEMTNTLFDVAIVSLNEEKQQFLAKSGKWLFGADDSELEEMNSAIDSALTTNKESCESLRDKKLEEIEQAYQLYLDNKSEKESDEVAKSNEKAAYSMRMDDDE